MRQEERAYCLTFPKRAAGGEGYIPSSELATTLAVPSSEEGDALQVQCAASHTRYMRQLIVAPRVYARAGFGYFTSVGLLFTQPKLPNCLWIHTGALAPVGLH